jgi:nucleoside-diphosphate-sugar epimerase
MATRVLVTGGAGYIGSVLSERLLSAGFHVTVLDRLLWNQNGPFHLCNNRNYEFIRGDSRDEKLVAALVKSVDAIIPLAAIVGAPACDSDPWIAQSTNLDAIRMINRLRSRSQPVIYPNTNSGYGAKSGDLHCTEKTPLEPISLYGRTKVQAEEELLSTPNTVSLRLATVFGMSPRMRLDLLVNHFVYVAVTDGYVVIFERHFKRNYIHVRDVADAFVHALSNVTAMQGKAFNAGLDAANLSKEELARKIAEHVPNFHIQYSEVGSDPDKRNYIVSNARLKEAGFQARRGLDEGIVELVKGYRMIGRHPFKNV